MFCIDIEASKTVKITGVSRPAINRIFAKIRERIADDCERISPFEHGSVELDESYFGPKRVRGRGAGKKVPVFGMLQRGGKVYTQVVNHCSMAEIPGLKFQG